eukprot:4718825-Prymnesium_polylepis.3
MSSRIAIRKKAHSRVQPEPEQHGECAICFENMLTVGDRAATKSFACSHFICVRCDEELYKRAEDRCPTCRASRTRASVQARAGNNDCIRRNAMARRIQEQGGVTATIFFPAGNVEELTLNAFRQFTQALTEGGQVESSGPASDPDVRRVLAGLIHVESVPLNEFTALTGSMRARNMLRSALSMARNPR